MSNVCPNTNSQEWKDLVAALGEGDAMTVFVQNNYQIPTVDVGKRMIKDIQVLEKDEQLSRTSDGFKLKRAIAQRTMLEQMYASSNIAQKDSIAKLMQMNKDYQDFLRENLRLISIGEFPKTTISVSNFIGTSDFKGDSTQYEDFKRFGTFMHEVIELSQVKAISEGKTIGEVFNMEYFMQLYKNYTKKFPFQIENYTPEEMFYKAMGIIQSINVKNFENYVILPEVTVVGTNIDGSKIIGRVDLMLIDPQGNIEIYDFKTKKTDGLVISRPDGSMYTDTDNALVQLAASEYSMDLGKTGVSNSFRQVDDGKRSPFDTWTVQLDLYDQILKQNGITVTSKKIAALLYQTEQETKRLLGSVLHIFNNQDYYQQMYNTGIDTNGYWMHDPSTVTRRLDALKRAIKRELPVPGEEVEQDVIEEKIKKAEETYEFQPGEEQMKKFTESLRFLVDGQIAEIYRVLSEMEDSETKNEELIKILETRKQTLISFKKIVDNNQNNPSKLLQSVNFFTAVDQVAFDLEEMSNIAEESIKNFRDKDRNISKSKNEIKQLTDAFRKSNALLEIIAAMEEVVNQASKNPENNITPDSNIRKKLSSMYMHHANIEANFREISLLAGADIFASVGKTVYERLSDEARQALVPKLERLKDQLSRLKAGEGLGVMGGIRTSVLSFVSKDFKERLKEKMNTKDAEMFAVMEDLEKQIFITEAQINGFGYSTEFFTEYISGIMNPDSDIFLGSRTWNNDSYLKGWNTDQFIASASNSERAVATFAIMLKNAEAQARWNMQQDESLTEFDNLRQNLVAKYGIDKLNDMISEWRPNLFFNNETGAIDSRSMLYITKPYSAEYEKRFKEFSLKLKQFNREIQELRADYNSKIGTPEEADSKNTFLKKQEERASYKKEHMQWIIDNANMPYIDEFYELQKGLPEDIRENIQELYLEAEIIRNAIGKGNEILLNPEDFHRLKEIDVEIRKIKQDAKQRDPKFAQYLEMFNDLFEYDTDERYFKIMEQDAKQRFADSPENLKKWYEENMVTRPTQDWYNRLEKLYEEKYTILEGNDDVKELMERKSDILRPYKLNGRVNPKYITDEEIREIEEIDGKLEEIFEQLQLEVRMGGGLQLSPDQARRLKQINNEINSLTVKNQLNRLYQKEFNEMTNMLYKKLEAYKSAEFKLEDAKSKGIRSTIDEAEAEYYRTMAEFTDFEKEYEVFYNRNHTNKYKSVLTGYDVRVMANVRSFNYERAPSASVRDQYTETVPNPKYYKVKKVREKRWYVDGKILSTKEIDSMTPEREAELEAAGRLEKRPGGMNPNFIKGPDGVPLPKGVYLDSDGAYRITSGYESSPNMNTKYMEIMKDPEVFKFYNSMIKTFFNLQRQTEGRKIGWLAPGFASSRVEDISREGFQKAFGRSWEKFKDRNLKLTGEQDIADNIFGDAGNRIRMRYTQQLSEDLQSKDVIGCVMKYAVEAHFNIAMQDVAPKADAFIEHLKLLRSDIEKKLSGRTYRTEEVIVDGKKVKKRVEVNMKERLEDLNKIIDQLEFEKRKLINGQLETDKNRAAKKIINNLFAYTSFIRIGFDIANQTKNYVAGNVQAFIAAGGYDSDHYMRVNWLYAKKRVYSPNDGFISNFFRDYGKITNLHETTMLYRFFNPLQKDPMSWTQDISGGKGRKLASESSIGELSHLLQESGDTEIAATVMFAVLDHYKFTELERDANGNMVPKRDAEGNEVKIPAHQCYIKGKNGELVRRKDVMYTVEDESRLRNTIYAEMRRAQGNYAASDMTKAQETIIGKMAFFFRKFLVPGILNRFGYLRPNYESGDMALGYWRAMWDANKYFGAGATIKEFLLGTKLLKKMNMEGVTTIKIKDPTTGKVESKEVGDFYARKIAHARRDAMAMGILFIASMLIKAYVQGKDDDDDQLSILEGNAYRVIWGTYMETASMFPVGGGSQEYVKNFTTAIPFVREMQQSIKFSDHLLKYMMVMTINGGTEPDPDYDSEFYNEIYKDAFYQRKSGAYKPGDPKIAKDLMDLTGLKNFRDLLDPNYRVDIMKRNI